MVLKKCNTKQLSEMRYLFSTGIPCSTSLHKLWNILIGATWIVRNCSVAFFNKSVRVVVPKTTANKPQNKDIDREFHYAMQQLLSFLCFLQHKEVAQWWCCAQASTVKWNESTDQQGSGVAWRGALAQYKATRPSVNLPLKPWVWDWDWRLAHFS